MIMPEVEIGHEGGTPMFCHTCHSPIQDLEIIRDQVYKPTRCADTSRFDFLVSVVIASRFPFNTCNQQ